MACPFAAPRSPPTATTSRSCTRRHGVAASRSRNFSESSSLAKPTTFGDAAGRGSGWSTSEEVSREQRARTRARQSGSDAAPDVPLVLDTGPILALLDGADADHGRCLRMVDNVREDLVVPVVVLVEVDYWARKRLGEAAWSTFVEDVAEGAYRLESLTVADLTRAAELERRYANLDLGLVDASVVALCERLGETKVATLDHRDFSVVQPRHCERLTLLPP